MRERCCTEAATVFEPPPSNFEELSVRTSASNERTNASVMNRRGAKRDNIEFSGGAAVSAV